MGQDAGPGWYADPREPRIQRWWDGQSWTAETRQVATPGDADDPPAPGTTPHPPEGNEHDTHQTEGRTRAKRRRLVLVAAFGLAAISLLGGGFVLGGMFSDSGDGEAAPEAAAPDPDGGSEHQNGEPADPSGLTTPILEREWQRAVIALTGEEDTGSDNPAAMYSVVRGGPGWVAVGGDGRKGAVWVSEDARSWDRIDHDASAFQGELLMRLTSVVTGGPGLVAVGWDGFPPGGGESRAVVLTSTDGREWERVPHDPAVFGDREPGDGLTLMESVARTDHGLIAAGQAPTTDGGSAAAFWSSRDGLVWERIDGDRRAFGGSGTQRVNALAVDGGTIVAVGTNAIFQEDHGGPGVWVSSAAGDWNRGTVSEHVGTYMTDVIDYAGGFVSVGADFRDSPEVVALWQSDDGLSWTRAALQGEPPTGWLDALSADGNQLVAVGSDQEGLASVWTSADGRNWTEVPGPPASSPADPAQQLLDIEVVDDLIVVVGRDAEGPATWLLPPNPGD